VSSEASSDAILDRLLTLHPKIIDLTLDRVWRLLVACGNPQNALPPVVHIAGTNGKGSTQAMIRAGLEAAGKSVHAYTSPHLARFHERIRVRGELISEPDLAALLAECEDLNGGIPITFFEITTVAAMLAFARSPADMVLLEVGLGGRLDATNIVERPALTVITPVSIDHQQYLGTTLGEIAGEKAGILKPGVPCIVGQQSGEALEVIQDKADRIGAPLLIHGQDWIVRTEHGRVVYEDDRGLLDLDPPVLTGAHQIHNAGVAIAALRLLGIDDLACQRALRDVHWPARMQQLAAGPLVEQLPKGVELWLDGGHNAAAGEAIAAILDDWHGQGKTGVSVIAGMLETKSAADFLRPIGPRISGMRTVVIPASDASFEAGALSEIAQGLGIASSPSPSVDAALASLLETITAPNRILICGSLYLAGHVLKTNG